MLTIKIDTSGAAFCDTQTGEKSALYRKVEVASILNKILGEVMMGYEGDTCRDSNGNVCGSWEFTDDDEIEEELTK